MRITLFQTIYVTCTHRPQLKIVPVHHYHHHQLISYNNNNNPKLTIHAIHGQCPKHFKKISFVSVN